MVKKSEQDRLRSEFFQREMRKREALKGPFRCPKCLRDKKLQCRTTREDVKESYTSFRGETSIVVVNYTHYRFTCPVCKFNRHIVRRASKHNHIIDIYSSLYDEELSESQRKEQASLIRDRRYRVLELPLCEVKMK